MDAIKTVSLKKYYGKSRGIDGINLTVKEGDFFGFIGPNGAGKSTTVRTLLGLISFLTAGSDECRAWTIKNGTKAPQAAGKIHSDFERGFIRAEVIAFDDLIACGTMAAAKAKGLVRSEGKEYVMKDGDIVNFLFNV